MLKPDEIDAAFTGASSAHAGSGLLGFVGGFALLVGAVLGLVWRTPARVVGVVMASGAGVLISAVVFERRAGWNPRVRALAAAMLTSGRSSRPVIDGEAVRCPSGRGPASRG